MDHLVVNTSLKYFQHPRLEAVFQTMGGESSQDDSRTSGHASDY